MQYIYNQYTPIHYSYIIYYNYKINLILCAHCLKHQVHNTTSCIGQLERDLPTQWH